MGVVILVEAPVGRGLEFVDWAHSCIAKTNQGLLHKCCDMQAGSTATQRVVGPGREAGSWRLIGN